MSKYGYEDLINKNNITAGNRGLWPDGLYPELSVIASVADVEDFYGTAAEMFWYMSGKCG